MAKNTADPCMFCDSAPCVCNAPKKAPAKRAAKKVAPPAKAEAPAEVASSAVTPQREPAQPSMLAQRKALASSKKPIQTGPIKPMAKTKRSEEAAQDEMELTRVLRMFNEAGMLSEETKRQHATRLRYPQVSPTAAEILKRLPAPRSLGEGKEGTDDNRPDGPS